MKLHLLNEKNGSQFNENHSSFKFNHKQTKPKSELSMQIISHSVYEKAFIINIHREENSLPQRKNELWPTKGKVCIIACKRVIVSLLGLSASVEKQHHSVQQKLILTGFKNSS